MKNAEFYMKKAIKLAQKAGNLGEVPIGAVIVKDGKVLASAYNKRNTLKDATCHAEVIAIKKACKKVGDWRLDGAEMYVTLEPCPMCAGAIINARIKKVYFGVLEEECSSLLKKFFAEKR